MSMVRYCRMHITFAAPRDRKEHPNSVKMQQPIKEMGIAKGSTPEEVQMGVAGWVMQYNHVSSSPSFNALPFQNANTLCLYDISFLCKCKTGPVLHKLLQGFGGREMRRGSG